MPRANLDVLDVNIVTVLFRQFAQNIVLRDIFEAPQLSDLLRPPLSYSQGVAVDVQTGTAMASYQVESMRSQKTVSLNALRIEVHDRSGKTEAGTSDLAPLMLAVLDVLAVESITAIGANYEVTSKFPESQISAAHSIAQKLLQQGAGFLPSRVKLDGTSARLFLSEQDAITYIIAVEPRFNDPKTLEAFLSCNVQKPRTELPSLDELNDLLQKGYEVLSNVADQLLA